MIYNFIIFAILGACIGSVLNAVAVRWGKNESIVFEVGANGKKQWTRSRCMSCGHVLSGIELIPIVSFVMQRGRCKACHVRLSSQYVLVEIAAAVLGALPWLVLWWNEQHAWLCSFQSMCASVAPLFFPIGAAQAAVIAVFSWILLFLFLYDLRYQIILDRVSVPAALLAVLTSVYLFGRTWESIGLGVLIGGGLFAVQFIVSRGKWIGGGDMRMGFLMGALLGLPSTVVALLLTYCIGAGVAIYLLLTGKAKRDTKIALGTFIALATVICLYIGDALANWYLGILGL